MLKAQKITKAIFPVAGLGTRFLPATKASPKEMLPIVDKPLIQYAVEEAIEAGITELIFVTGRNKRSIEDHFDRNPELEAELNAKNKLAMLELTQNILPKNVNCIYIRQSHPLGLGHAVLCAKSIINDEPFVVMLADELLDATPGGLSQMMAVYAKTNSSVLGVCEVDKNEVSAYGIIKTETLCTNYSKIEQMIEKPKVENAPSNLAAIGRYILTSRIMTELEKTKHGIGGEIQLTDAICGLLKSEAIYAKKIEGIRYDCGSKLGYIEATIGFGLKHEETRDGLKKYLNRITKEIK